MAAASKGSAGRKRVELHVRSAVCGLQLASCTHLQAPLRFVLSEVYRIRCGGGFHRRKNDDVQIPILCLLKCHAGDNHTLWGDKEARHIS